jgi:chemotaxis protein CheC
MELTEDQVDILKEVFNLGMGRSLKALSKITGEDEEITATLPNIRLIKYEDFIDTFSKGEENVFISQNYSGEINGQSLMFFLNSKKCEFARILIDSSLPAEEISNLESDALIEIGNIFINAAISSLSDFLEIEIQTDIPEILTQNLILKNEGSQGLVIFLDSIFRIKHMDIEGQMGFLMGNNTIDILIKKINQSLE